MLRVLWLRPRVKLLVGQRISSYVVADLLGEGGTSEVYLVHRDDQSFALKILKEEHRRNAVQQARLVNEAEALRVLDIPGVVQVFGDGDFEGRPYYVMEYLPTTLAERLGKPLLPSQIVPVIEKLARILAQLHARGYVHRDLKPRNILFALDGSLRLADFGLAKLPLDQLAVVPHSTATGAFLGTHAYAAPEQLLNAKSVDGRADVYALGLILFEALAGRPPFPAENAEELAHLRLTKRAPRMQSPRCELSPELVALTAQLLDRTSALRPTAKEVYERLSRIPLLARPSRRQSWLRLALLCLVCSLLGPQPPNFDSIDELLAQGLVGEAQEALTELTVRHNKPIEQARLLQKTADLALAAGRLHEAAAGFRDAAKAHDERGDIRRQLSCQAQLAEALQHLGQLDEVHSIYQAALESQPVLLLQNRNRGDELQITWLRLAIEALERRDFATARSYLERVRKVPGGPVRLSRTEELLASIPGEKDALSLAHDAIRHANDALRAEPNRYRAHVAKWRAELRLAELTASPIKQVEILNQLFAAWRKAPEHSVWAHEFLEAAVVYIRHRPADWPVRGRIREVLGFLDSNHQLSGDVHVLRWRNELAALGLAEHAVLDQKGVPKWQ